jgi:PAS domain S-box-containing protein
MAKGALRSFMTANLEAPDSPWETPRSCGHSVQFYEDDSYLLDGLTKFIASTLVAGEAALVIATQSHRNELGSRLTSGGLDFAPAIAEGRFITLDASETLAKFMEDGQLVASRFHEVIGSVISRLGIGKDGNTRRVAAFGEMVALLWADRKTEAAIRLEQLWNSLAEQHSFQLHCAYPLVLFAAPENTSDVERICSQHTHVTPSEQYTRLDNKQARSRAVALLQQKSLALETQMQERDRLYLDMQEREAELADFLENAVIPMHWVGADGTILWANRAELALMGHDRNDYIGHHIAEFHADSHAINEILERLNNREELLGYKARLRRKDGSIRIVRVYSNVFCRGGEFVHTRCFTIDITERDRSERRIAAQLAITKVLAHSRSLTSALPPILETICSVSDCDFAAVWQLQERSGELGCVETWTRRKYDFSAFDSLTKSSIFQKGIGLPGRTWRDNQPAWIADLSTDENLPRKATAIADGLLSAFAFPIAVRDKFFGVIEFFSRQRHEVDQEFMTMMAGIGIQLGQFTERKQAEEAQNRLAAIVESSDDAIISKDLNGIVTSWNKGADRIFGYEAHEIVGHSITKIIPPELQQDETMILSKIRGGERIDHFETIRQTKDGARINVSLTISPVKDHTGKIIGAAKIARDVTQQRKIEQALHTSERLASVGRLAATVAHEINNPLEAVMNYIYLAKQQPGLTDNLQRYLTSADCELGRVAHIAQQTLGFYRDNSQPVTLFVAKVVSDVLAIYEGKIAYKELHVKCEVEPELAIFALQGELKQVLSNLISNAIEACNEAGNIIIRARASKDHRTGHSGARISVADTGGGISEENKARVFAPFFTTKNEVGTGLGLWITKDLLEKKGGHIRFRSSNANPSGTVMHIFVPSISVAAETRVA